MQRLLQCSSWAHASGYEPARTLLEWWFDSDAQIKSVLGRHYRFLYNVFSYYGAMGSAQDSFSIQYNAYSDMLDDARIPESDSKYCTMNDLSTVFVSVNFEEDKTSEESKVNLDRFATRRWHVC